LLHNTLFFVNAPSISAWTIGQF